MGWPNLSWPPMGLRSAEAKLKTSLPRAVRRMKEVARLVITLFTIAITETICLGLCACLLPTSWIRTGTLRASHIITKKHPILLIHGYLHNDSGWIYVRKRLMAAGFGPIYTINLGQSLSSIDDHARSVSRKIEQIRAEHNNANPILIGHSMGGLVASHYNEYQAEEGKASHVITLASPLHGTRVAHIAVGICGREMEWKSPYTNELTKKIRANQHGVHYYHLACQIDQLVIPHHSALTGIDPDKERVVENHGHLGVLFSRKVTSQIMLWLNQVHGALAANSPSQKGKE